MVPSVEAGMQMFGLMQRDEDHQVLGGGTVTVVRKKREGGEMHHLKETGTTETGAITVETTEVTTEGRTATLHRSGQWTPLLPTALLDSQATTSS
jgi:hypothetical protein